MQSAIPASGEVALIAGNNLPRGTSATQFVINLSASTSPMGLTPPTLPELKRFKFFISRRREEGRERFRLHMGYFDSQEEAEKLLELVREIYPAAWAGVAPGQRLHAPVPDVAQPPIVAGPVAVSSPRNRQTAPAVTAAAPGSAAPAAVAAERPFVLSLVEDAPPRAGSGASGTPQKIDSTSTPTLSGLPVLGPAHKRQEASQSEATQSMDSVRAAIASLDESKPAAAKPRVASTSVAPPRPAAPPPPARTPVTGARPAQAPPVAASPEPDSLSASQTLRVLEQGAAQAASARPEPTLFAVQLLWSVQPIDQSKIPPLAIFSAYTLYGAEGNRDGRRWYGLRLGFFTDTVSAQQVAHYVRSEFKAVSVVPVSSRERERASGAAAKPKESPAPARASPPPAAAAAAVSGEFKLIDDRTVARPAEPAAAAPKVVSSAAGAGASQRAPKAAPKTAPGKRAKYRAGRVTKAAATGKLSLEETLEILGANSLQIDKGRGELLNDSGLHRVSKGGPKGTRGSSLLSLIDRLTERFGNN
jgi:hypothetical protein